mmetsp:Transcript_26081/g.54453  ORF Transcript_26081/g.54453 Transcript_26081/m.54453 type:complete len:177 (-) Transcript_26081:159-689(-)
MDRVMWKVSQRKLMSVSRWRHLFKKEVEILYLTSESAEEDIKPDICLNQSTTRKRKFYPQCKFCAERNLYYAGLNNAVSMFIKIGRCPCQDNYESVEGSEVVRNEHRCITERYPAAKRAKMGGFEANDNFGRKALLTTFFWLNADHFLLCTQKLSYWVNVNFVSLLSIIVRLLVSS